MNRVSLSMAASFLSITSAPLFLAQEAPPRETRGQIDAVTVYRGQALVTRAIAVPGPAGLQEIVITDLPSQVVPGSLYAESTDGIQVRSVSYRTRPVLKDVRDDVRALDAKIRATQDEIGRRKHQLDLLTQRKEYLIKLEQFTADTAAREHSQSVLDPAKLKEMTSFLFEERGTISNAEQTIALENRDLEEALSLLQRERQQLTNQSSTVAREAVLFVNVTHDDGGPLQLRYLVNAANWSPSYNLRAEEGSGHLVVEYAASIQQMSGENWDDVTMHLSTATPTLVSMAPELQSLSIGLLAQLPQDQQAAYRDATRAYGEIQMRQRAVESSRNRAEGAFQAGAPSGAEPNDEIRGVYFARKQLEFDESLNDLAQQAQVLELAAEKSFDKKSKGIESSTSPQPEEGLSITYMISGRTSLPSRSDQQFIQIASMPMEADFYQLATPVLSNSVFDQAKVVNRSKLVLLEGPAASYMNGRFVGHGSVPTVAVGEDFTAGFGIDSSLRASRELAERQDSIQGGNRIVTLTYQLMVSNFADDQAVVRIVDRMPVSKDSAIKIELVKSSHALRESKTRDKDGILSWDVDVAGRTNGEPIVVEYTIRLEYDKNMQISGI